MTRLFSAVQTLIGQQLDVIDSKKLPQVVRDRQVVTFASQAYVYSKLVTQRADIPGTQVPTVIYQDADWHRDSIREILAPLGLWNPNRFGVWVLTTTQR
jgi:hypothetical protein